jgi:Ni/Fe-hydrogenase subunit HybB-like protein
MSDNTMQKSEFKRVFSFILSEFKIHGKLLTPFNVISILIMLASAVIIVVRFAFGLGSVTNLNQDFAWGLWKGLNVVTGVAFAGGAYAITFVVYVLHIKKYHPIVRVTVLNGFLAYIFYAGALILELGRPWNIFNPIIGNSFGYNSVLFLVAWHFLLYIIAQFIEFSPVAAEWLGLDRLKKILKSLTLGAVIFGITLSMLHQSGLGALFLLAKSKIHPLWYSEFLPILFLISSVPAGLSMVILEGSISIKVFADRMEPDEHKRHEDIIVGLSKGAAISLFVYYFFKAIIFIHGKQWDLLFSFWGILYLLEVYLFVLVPCVLFAHGAKIRNTGLIRIAAIMTACGIILNRLNVSLIAFNWNSPNHYYPTWMEVIVSAGVLMVEVWVFRWIVLRMPVFEKRSEV